MRDVLHIPMLRMGEVYRSLDTRDVVALGTDDVVARLSVGNAGVLRRDALRFDEARDALRGLSCERLIEICGEAGRLFMESALPIGDGDAKQSADEYVRQLSSTSGLPHSLVRANMLKIHDALTHMRDIVRGLTRGLDLSVIDDGVGEIHDDGSDLAYDGVGKTRGKRVGVPVSFYATTNALGVVMPSNSPGVNALWLPAIAFKTPVVIKPGSEEPWTPWRIIQALFAAGLPRQAIGFYPTDHEGAGAVTEVCQRSITFGGEDAVRRHAGDARVEVHGPGWSKIIIGDDMIDRWEEFVDVIVQSIAANSGRSCINASTILVSRHADEIAVAVAKRLNELVPMGAGDPNARLSAIANPAIGQWADTEISQGLKTSGARDVTAALRSDAVDGASMAEGLQHDELENRKEESGGERLVEFEGRTYMLPTLIHCESWAHPLSHREFMFPFSSIVEMAQADMLSKIGTSLVVTAITENATFIDELIRCPMIQRLNLGPIPTSRARWDQPHEGNLFELLYQRRAIQHAHSMVTMTGASA